MIDNQHAGGNLDPMGRALSQAREIDAQGLQIFCRDNGENTMTIVLEVEMGQSVDGDALGEAVRQAELRYQSFGSGLATTGHGLCYVPLASPASAYEEVPGKRWLLGTDETGGRLYRVTYVGSYITVSLHHGLTDGRGAFEYLKTLLYYYLVTLGHSVNPEGKVLLLGDAPSNEDEFPFAKYGKAGSPEDGPSQGSPRLFGINEDYLDERGEHLCRYVEITAPVESVVSAARDARVTVTSLLVTAAYRAIAQTYHPEDELVISCATADLRPLFDSATVQNFAGWISLAEVPAMRGMPIEAEAQALGQQLAAGHGKDMAMSRMGQRLSEVVPLREAPADELFGNEESRMVEKRGTRSKLAFMVTNVGVVDLPEDILQHVRQASFRIPSFNATISIAVSTCGDTLTINLTQPFASEGFSRALAEVLSQLGIPVSLDDRGLEAYDILEREAVDDLA